MKITTSLLAIALTAMTVPLSSYAESGKHARCHQHVEGFHGADKQHEAFRMRGVPHHLAALNLSEAQQDKVFELMHAQMPTARQADKQRLQLTEELHKLSSSDTYNEAKAKQLSEKLAAIEKEVALNRATTNHQVYQILTPEQRKQLNEMKSRHEEGLSKSRFEGCQHSVRKLDRVS